MERANTIARCPKERRPTIRVRTLQPRSVSDEHMENGLSTFRGHFVRFHRGADSRVMERVRSVNIRQIDRGAVTQKKDQRIQLTMREKRMVAKNGRARLGTWPQTTAQCTAEWPSLSN